MDIHELCALLNQDSKATENQKEGTLYSYSCGSQIPFSGCLFNQHREPILLEAADLPQNTIRCLCKDYPQLQFIYCPSRNIQPLFDCKKNRWLQLPEQSAGTPKRNTIRKKNTPRGNTGLSIMLLLLIFGAALLVWALLKS